MEFLFRWLLLALLAVGRPHINAYSIGLAEERDDKEVPVEDSSSFNTGDQSSLNTGPFAGNDSTLDYEAEYGAPEPQLQGYEMRTSTKQTPNPSITQKTRPTYNIELAEGEDKEVPVEDYQLDSSSFNIGDQSSWNTGSFASDDSTLDYEAAEYGTPELQPQGHEMRTSTKQTPSVTQETTRPTYSIGLAEESEDKEVPVEDYQSDSSSFHTGDRSSWNTGPFAGDDSTFGDYERAEYGAPELQPRGYKIRPTTKQTTKTSVTQKKRPTCPPKTKPQTKPPTEPPTEPQIPFAKPQKPPMKPQKPPTRPPCPHKQRPRPPCPNKQPNCPPQGPPKPPCPYKQPPCPYEHHPTPPCPYKHHQTPPCPYRPPQGTQPPQPTQPPQGPKQPQPPLWPPPVPPLPQKPKLPQPPQVHRYQVPQPGYRYRLPPRQVKRSRYPVAFPRYRVKKQHSG